MHLARLTTSNIEIFWNAHRLLKMFAKLKKKVLEEGEAGGPERLAFSPRKLPGGAVAVRSPPGVGGSPSFGGGTGDEGDGVGGERGGEGGEKEIGTKTEEAKPLLMQSIDLVRKLGLPRTLSCQNLSITFLSALPYFLPPLLPVIPPFFPFSSSPTCSTLPPSPPTYNPASHKRQSTRNYCREYPSSSKVEMSSLHLTHNR